MLETSFQITSKTITLSLSLLIPIYGFRKVITCSTYLARGRSGTHGRDGEEPFTFRSRTRESRQVAAVAALSLVKFHRAPHFPILHTRVRTDSRSPPDVRNLDWFPLLGPTRPEAFTRQMPCSFRENCVSHGNIIHTNVPT